MCMRVRGGGRRVCEGRREKQEREGGGWGCGYEGG